MGGVRVRAWQAASASTLTGSSKSSSDARVGFVGLLAIVLIHLLDVIGKVSETPSLGVMYIGLMIASVTVAFALLHTGRPVAWMAPGAPAGLTLIGFILSRTTGLPSATDDTQLERGSRARL